MQLKTHKLNKYLKLKSDEHLVAKRSIYHRFGQYILRLSDHIGKSSSGTFSIIVDKNDKLMLHTHSSGYIINITYEEAKDFIRSLHLCADLCGNIGIQWEKEKEKATLGNDADEISKLRSEVERLKMENEKLSVTAKSASKGLNKLNSKLTAYKTLLADAGIADPMPSSKTPIEIAAANAK